MARTRFSGPVKSDNGFEGDITGDVVGSVTLPVETVAAAGSGATTATAATVYGIIVATGADGTKGIKLPTAAAGKQVVVKNTVAQVLKVYPGTSDKINGGTATTGSLDMASGTSTLLFAYDAENWFSVPLIPS
jgi:hypothetical protein